eukprot:12446307-Alexandrium_andersonii.AAC.1
MSVNSSVCQLPIPRHGAILAPSDESRGKSREKPCACGPGVITAGATTAGSCTCGATTTGALAGAPPHWGTKGGWPPNNHPVGRAGAAAAAADGGAQGPPAPLAGGGAAG